MNEDGKQELLAVWLDEVNGLTDEQRILVWEMSRSNGFSFQHEITAGEFRARLRVAASQESDFHFRIHMDDERKIVFDGDEHHWIEVVTAEVAARLTAEADENRMETDLGQLGVDTSIFWDVDPEWCHATRKFTVRQVYEMSRVIVQYCESHGIPADTSALLLERRG